MTNKNTTLTLLLAGLSAIGPFSIDAYLPAFPAVGASLHASPVEVQQTLAAFLLPFSFMMLWHGALSDALGRRRVILAGLGLYVLASALCIFATRIEYLLLGRALQGLSAGAGMVVGRAMIRDILDGAAAQKLMSHVSVVYAIAPAIGPVVGGWTLAFFDWHGIFAFLVLFGAALWLACWRWLPETLPPTRRQSLHPVQLGRAYLRVFSDHAFVRLAAALAFSFSGFFLYVLSAPVFLVRHLGLSPQAFSWMFLPMVAGIMGGSFVSGQFAGRLSQTRTIALGYAVMIAAAAFNIALNLAWPPGLPWSVLPLPLYTFGMAMTMPSLQIKALDLFPDNRGLASSCQAAVLNGTSTISAALLAPLLWGSTLTLACGMAGFLLLGLASFALWLSKRAVVP